MASIITVASGERDPAKLAFAIQQLAERVNRGAPSFYAHKNGTNQSGLTHGAYTAITYPTERSDVGGYYDPSTSLWTPPPGLVILFAYTFIIQHLNGSAVPVIAIRKNGVNRMNAIGNNFAGLAGLAGFGSAMIIDIDQASGADTYGVNLSVTSDTAGNDVVVDGNEFHTHFSGALL